ncbi:hypothetical protein [Azospirillum canadense]|uniref:hypothetical protein n=1 Tax=Azospirillum canadense TaxID=403962 RepID=UPI00222680F0|nr:hypothetical protein [Azospirillum canadense]MCW2237947.1 hypothetical protein [Azospirillum canadense]
MKLLVYGMQSSGATAFTLFLAQRPDCLGLVDIPNSHAAPRVDPPMDMVAKAVVTTTFPLAVHIERFQPDKTILLLRDPRDNYQSLKTKPYGNLSGPIDEKFRLMDQIFAERAQFDAVVEYEDFVARDPAVPARVSALGWPVEDSFHGFARRHDAIIGDLWRHMPDLFQRMEIVFGNVQGREVSERFRDKPRDAALDAHLETLCPCLLAHYRARRGA